MGAPSVVNVVINIVSHAARGLRASAATLTLTTTHLHCRTNHVVGGDAELQSLTELQLPPPSHQRADACQPKTFTIVPWEFRWGDENGNGIMEVRILRSLALLIIDMVMEKLHIRASLLSRLGQKIK